MAERCTSRYLALMRPPLARHPRTLEWAAQLYSDYCDVVIQPTDKAALDMLWAAIVKAGGFDLVRLKHVRPGAAVVPWLHAISAEERGEICLQVARQWPDGASWLGTCNKKTRNNHARGGRILDSFGAVVFRQLGAHEPREPVITRLIELKRLMGEQS